MPRGLLSLESGKLLRNCINSPFFCIKHTDSKSLMFRSGWVLMVLISLVSPFLQALGMSWEALGNANWNDGADAEQDPMSMELRTRC
jgi:hypothetical protein